jgi:hypothetical protein
MAHCLHERRRHERKRREERDCVPMHRADEAREAVEPDPRPSVEVGLEQGEAGRACEEEPDRVQPRAPQS